MTLPTVTVVLLTYQPVGRNERTQYAVRTVESLMKNLRYDGGDLRFHIADDGSQNEHVAAISREFDQSLLVKRSGRWYRRTDRQEWTDESTVTDARRGGYGRSYNLASQYAHGNGEYILPIEDDWVLTRPLELTPLVQALEQNPQFGCIRLGYLGHTQPLYGQFLFLNGSTYIELAATSPEPHVAAGHPRLVTRTWERNIGPWIENTAAGATEFDWCRREPARHGVLWPADLVHPRGDLFAHIGSETLGELDPS